MENDALFTKIPENMKPKKQGKQHLHNLTTQTDSKSLIITVTALSVPLGVYLFINSHCGQNSKEIRRRSNTLQSHLLFSAPLGGVIPFSTGCDVT
ncbi:hypothetical protein AVEN_209311-1 [Araneus ventricosus]|uniref:Uncharacterized protein n=1 Tax=Araneus ventricosus TaxID=182803 RepID=A0A4Y2CAR0_ARAVE|nr:hypothetical protein AVEN_209311-1 [Araneus ventricosus]